MNDRLHDHLLLAIAVLHIIWAGLVLIDHSALNATPLAEFRNMEPWHVGFVLCAVSACAMVGTWLSTNQFIRLALFVPQQTVLILSAMMVFSSIIMGQYIDGTIVSRPHLAADQILVIIVAIVHGMALRRAAQDT